MILKFIHKILEALYPARCLHCGQVGTYLCLNDQGLIPPAETNDLIQAFALFDYNHPLAKKIIWRLKYRGLKKIADDLAAPLYQLILPEIADIRLFNCGKILVVPIPLSPKRLRWRGFNQAAELGRALAEQDAVTLEFTETVLRKIKDTPTQVSLKDRQTRLKNLRGAFALTNQPKIKGVTIILIDDVITTGGTMNEARRLLLKAGARNVWSLAVAHG